MRPELKSSVGLDRPPGFYLLLLPPPPPQTFVAVS
jgi:hypothetical protein